MDPVLTTDQLVQLLEVILGDKSPLLHTPSLIEVLKAYLPLLKRMLLTDTPAKQAVQVFNSLLTNLRNREESIERDMVCGILSDCLVSNQDCLSWWTDNMIHHMKSSSILLRYIKENGLNEKVRYGRKKGDFVIASQKMLSKLDEANERGRFEKKPGFRECRKLCSSIVQSEISRKKQSSFLGTLFKYIVLFTCIFVFVDVYTHKGYQGSRTSVFMKNYKLEEKIMISYHYAEHKTNQVTSYVMTHVPRYYATISPYVDPVMEKTRYYAEVTFTAVYQHSKPIREFVNKNLPPLLEKVTYFLRRQYEIITAFILNLYNTYSPLVHQNVMYIYNWLEVSVPKFYKYILNTCINLKKAIYDLHPTMFDQAAIIINDAIDYVIKMVPIIVERCSLSLKLLVESVRGYLVQGQGWMNQQFSSGTGAGN